MEELDTIIKSITDNLTGESQKDIKYLQGCIELYRDHPLHREISRACSQLLYKLMPEESRQHFADLFSKAFEKFRKDLEEARKRAAAKDFERNIRPCSSLIQKWNSAPLQSRWKWWCTGNSSSRRRKSSRLPFPSISCTSPWEKIWKS